MKKAICILLAGLFLFALSIPPAAAEGNESVPEWQDLSLTTEQFWEIATAAGNDPDSVAASGLIAVYGLAIAKNGSLLTIVGYTYCIPDVVKCGFKKLTVQRRASSSDSWSDYAIYNDLYDDFYLYDLTKYLPVPAGYQYRVTATHYAKKNVLSTQKINNTSNIVTM